MATEEDPHQSIKKQLAMAVNLVCSSTIQRKLLENTNQPVIPGQGSPMQTAQMMVSTIPAGTQSISLNNSTAGLPSRRQSTLDVYYRAGERLGGLPGQLNASPGQDQYSARVSEPERYQEEPGLGKRELQIDVKEDFESDASAIKPKKKHAIRSKTQGQAPEGAQSSEDSEVGSDPNAKVGLPNKASLSAMVAEGPNSTVTLDRFFTKTFDKDKPDQPMGGTSGTVQQNPTGGSTPPQPVNTQSPPPVISQVATIPAQNVQNSVMDQPEQMQMQASSQQQQKPTGWESSNQRQPQLQDQLLQQVSFLTEHCRKLEQSLAAYNSQRPQLLRLVLELEGYRRRERLEYIAHERIRLGEPGVGANGGSWSEGWEGSRLKVRLCELAQDRSRLEGIRKRVRKGIKKHSAEMDQNSQTTASTPSMSFQGFNANSIPPGNQSLSSSLISQPGLPNLSHIPLLNHPYAYSSAPFNSNMSQSAPLLSLLGSDGLPASEAELQSLEPGLSLKDLNEISRRLENKISTLSKEEQVLKEKLEQLDREKVPYLQESRLLSEEMSSTFGKPDPEDGRTHYPLFRDRYQLVGLLGKGGFSEVYKAFDLEELSYKAFKLHRLNPDWPDTTKQSFLKYATRECEVHRKLVHPNILRLHDVVPIGEHSFATVLEYCEGPDLARYIRRNKMIAEREAKIIIRQVLEALQYLSDLKDGKVIHYDLKPGNIIFHKGIIKVADFGLCKQLAADQNKTELTSVGVGTYWYLPPETFQVGSRQLSISPKVDIWSLGVVFFEMLYGAKPFGNGISQQEILKSNLMLRATHVEFPSKPNVTTETKDFIRKCLSYNPDDRYDINQAVQALTNTK